VSIEALRTAEENARALDLDVRFVHADVLGKRFPATTGGPFHLVVSNPPYIPASEAGGIMREVRDYEPKNALFVDGDPLLFYRAIVNHSSDILKPDGWLILEVNPEYAVSVCDLLYGAGFSDVSVKMDLAGRDRIVKGAI